MAEHDQTPTAGRDSNARLKTILRELERPLEPDSSLSLREHSRALKRARKAASKAYGVKPRHSARRRATMMLTAGAAGLTAFTGPQLSGAQTDQGTTQGLTETATEARMPAALLSASERLKHALMEEEGVRYTVYRDVAGYPTVGVGHLVRPEDGLNVGDTIDLETARRFLSQDLAEAERGVRELVGALPLFQHEFDALVDLVYNVGFGNVSPSESPGLNAAIAAGDYDAVASQLDYTHAGGRVARGLQYRSDRRAAMFADASYADPRSEGNAQRA